jgi:hypothetical protein
VCADGGAVAAVFSGELAGITAMAMRKELSGSIFNVLQRHLLRREVRVLWHWEAWRDEDMQQDSRGAIVVLPRPRFRLLCRKEARA